MKKYCLLLLLWIPTWVFAQEASSDKTLSPYFAVSGVSKGIDALPLKSTSADVNIAGVIADIVVTQTYVNAGNKALEAIYVFPASINAAVYGLTMQVGNRKITAKIAERAQARKDYEKAKSEGKRASLLEQERPNVFQMNVSNIMPGDTILVTLRYTELLVPEAGDYEFVFPTVVGPRYSQGGSSNNNGFTAMPYQKSGEKPHSHFDLSVHLVAGVPIHNVKSPSHRISVADNGGAGMNILLDVAETQSGNRDFILRYSLRNAKTEAGLLLFDDGKEKFFLCMAQPPKQPLLSEIPPREYIFVIDVSGSMNGFPVQVAQKLMANLIKGLRSSDQFNVILFAGASNLLSETSLTANNDNVAKAVEFINQQTGSGNTLLLPALERAIQLPRVKGSLSRSIVVVTDGYIDVEAEAFDLIKKNLDNANLFAFGIGSSVNRHLIDGLAHAGGGIPFIVTDEKEGEKAAEKLRQYIATPVLAQVKIQFSGFDAYDIEPSIVPDVFAQRPIVIMGKWRGNPSGAIIIQGFSGKQFQKIRVPVENAILDDRNVALKYIWARERIKMLSDYNIAGADPARDKKVTNLGLKYNLLTAFTSFIAIDEVVGNDGSLTTAKQALPMPQGVSDLAVGFDLGIEGISGLKTKPDSGQWGWIGVFCLLILGLVVGLFWKRKRHFGMFILAIMALGLTSCSEKDEVSICKGNSVAIILGEDHGGQNPYFSNAISYFRSDSMANSGMEISVCKNLQAAHDYIKMHRPEKGAWQQIHLVVHSNQWTGLRVPLNSESPNRTTTSILEEALRAGYLGHIPPSHFNTSTRIIVDGCNIGQDSQLLHALSAVFEGIPVVAARYFNVFEKQKEHRWSVQHYLADYNFVVFPNGTFPGNSNIAKELRAKYPNDSTDWVTALNQLKPRYSGDSYIYSFNVPIQWTSLYNHYSERPNPKTPSEIVSWIETQTELLQELSSMQLQVNDFSWQLTQTDYTKGNVSQPAIQLKGIAKIYGIVQPLKDKSGNLAKINHEDSQYYAFQDAGQWR
jgi:hypothetical protein